MDSKKVVLKNATLKEVFYGLTEKEEATEALNEIQALIDADVKGNELIEAVTAILEKNKIANLSLTSLISNSIASTMTHPR